MCQWRNTRPKSMLPHWIRSNSTTRGWGMLYKTYTHRYYFEATFPVWFGSFFRSNINQDDLPFGRAWLSAGPRGDWLRETQRECFMIGCEHTQQGQQWLDESAQRVTGADAVLLYSCCTRLPHTPLVCCTPETLCDWPGVDDLMRWKQIRRNKHFWELKIKARLYLISRTYERVSDLLQCAVWMSM